MWFPSHQRLLTIGLLLGVGFCPQHVRCYADSTTTNLLIVQLGSASFIEREKAAATLKEIGEPALDALRSASKLSMDLEIKQRAARLVLEIERRLYREIHRCDGHSEPVTGVSFSPDGNHVLSTGLDEEICVWDVRSGKQVARMRGDLACFSADGRQIIVAGQKCNQLGIHLVGRNEPAKVVNLDADEVAFAVSPELHALLTGYKDVLRMRDASSGKLLKAVKWSLQLMTTPAPIGDTPCFLVLCDPTPNPRLIVWDSQLEREVRHFAIGNQLLVATAISRDGTRALTAGYSRLATRNERCPLLLCDVKSGKVIRKLGGHKYGVRSLAISNDGRRALSGGEDKIVRLWNIERGEEIRAFSGHEMTVMSVAFSPDGRLAVTGSDDKTVRIWRLPK